ncbi:MAG: hypothetical protein IJK44_01775 [Bacteroidales bacterium]|nr:hypothetical protein [Bacteroidales bacterium]
MLYNATNIRNIIDKKKTLEGLLSKKSQNQTVKLPISCPLIFRNLIKIFIYFCDFICAFCPFYYLCEVADIMFRNCVLEGKPLPDYKESDDYQVTLRIQAVIENPRLFLFLHDWNKPLNAFELINLYYINKGEVDRLYTNSLARLIEKDVICDDNYFRFTFGNTYFSYAYPDRVKLYDASIFRLVYYAIKRKGSASSSVIIEQLKGLYTPKQTRLIISKMCNAGWLVQKGNRRATTYEWIG